MPRDRRPRGKEQGGFVEPVSHEVDHRDRPEPEPAGQDHETHLGHRGMRQRTLDVRFHQHDEGAVDHGRRTSRHRQYPRHIVGSQRSHPDQKDAAGVDHPRVQERRDRCGGGERGGKPTVKGDLSRPRQRRHHYQAGQHRSDRPVEGFRTDVPQVDSAPGRGSDRDHRPQREVTGEECKGGPSDSVPGSREVPVHAQQQAQRRAGEGPADGEGDQRAGRHQPGRGGSQQARAGDEPGRARITGEITHRVALHDRAHTEHQQQQHRGQLVDPELGGAERRRDVLAPGHVNGHRRSGQRPETRGECAELAEPPSHPWGARRCLQHRIYVACFINRVSSISCYKSRFSCGVAPGLWA